jgi:hypothetical protein
MAFDISALSAYTEENAIEFFSRSVLGSKIASMMNRRTGIKSSEALPTLAMTNDLFQAETNCTFVDGGNDLVIDQRTLTVQKLKIQEKFCINDLEPFFTQKILPAGSTYTDVPAELRFMEIVVERIRKTMELAVIEGELGGANPNASLNLFDGMDHIIADEIVALSIPLAQQKAGATTATNVIATLDAMYDALPDDNKLNVLQDGDWVFLVSPQTKVIYERDFRTTHGALPYNTGFDKDEYDTTGIKLVAVAGLTANPGQVILTRMSNWWMGVDVDGEDTSLTLEQGAGSEKRFLFLEGHFKTGIQVMFPDEMVVNGY